MVEARETEQASEELELPPTNVLYWLTVGYAALIGFGWLTMGMSRLLQILRYRPLLQTTIAQGNAELALTQQNFIGSLQVDLLFALGTALVFAYVLVALTRRTWNMWDHATIVIGSVAVLSAVFLCANGRVMFFIPFSAAPLLALLYTPGTKAACGVPVKAQPEPAANIPEALPDRAALEREIAKERTNIAQLAQNLDVFEVERSMKTDVFVRRYAEGLEEENDDNAEWFSIARMVRRSRERINELQAQIENIDHQNGKGAQ